MNRDLPPHMSDLLNRLRDTGRQFIELYEEKEERMRAIASNLGEISEEVTKMQDDTNATRSYGAVFGVFGIMGLTASLFAGHVGKILAVFGGTLFGGGTATVIGANVSKERAEKVTIVKVEEMVNEFMTITEQQKYVLERIKQVSEELEERSSALMTKTKAQAAISLSTTEQLQRLLRQTADLAEQSREVMGVTVIMEKQVGELLDLLINITRITPKKHEKFIDCIIDSALQCENTVKEFEKMRRMFNDFDIKR